MFKECVCYNQITYYAAVALHCCLFLLFPSFHIAFTLLSFLPTRALKSPAINIPVRYTFYCHVWIFPKPVFQTILPCIIIRLIYCTYSVVPPASFFILSKAFHICTSFVSLILITHATASAAATVSS